MTQKQYIVLAPVEYTERGVVKTTFKHLGPAFPARNADGFDINLELLPPPQIRTTTMPNGEVVIQSYWRILVREKTERQKSDSPSTRQPSREPGGDNEEPSPF